MSLSRIVAALILVVAGCSLGLAPLKALEPESGLPPAAERSVDFLNDVQPLFRKTCYSCHGVDAQESGLRLDAKSRALEGGDNGKVILPGQSEDSRLIHVVAGLDDEFGRMPPDGEGTPLTDSQIGILRRWIDEGAHWPAEADQVSASTHWSFQPIQEPDVPPVAAKDWVRAPIDAFILRKLRAEQIAPATEADRATLIRRLYLDVLGLLPDPATAHQFVQNESPNAYEQLVEQTLASPHFGERWGRHWLDLARYADSDGYEKDRGRPHAWRYREWVIRALNADMPYDLFSINQLAGDMMPEASIEQQVASGFHRNTLHNTEGGTDPEEDRVKKTVDRTNTMGAIWLGLTVGCAQCHSHKYDPLTQREYFSLYGFFNDIDEAQIDAPLPADALRLAQAKENHQQERKRLESALQSYDRDSLADAQNAWEETALATSVQWKPLSIEAASSKNGAELKAQSDQSFLVTGKNQRSDRYTLVSANIDQPTLAIRLEVLPHDELPKKGPGRSGNGNFVLTTFEVYAESVTGGDPVRLTLTKPKASHAQKSWPIEAAINADPKDGWAVSPKFGERHVGVFRVGPTDLASPYRLRFELHHQYEKGDPHNLGCFRLSTTDAEGELSLEGLSAAVASALAVTPSKRTSQQKEEITQYFRTIDPSRRQLEATLAEHDQNTPQPSPIKARSVVERKDLRTTRVHVRGDFLNPGEEVVKRVPGFLPDLAIDQPNRLDLAQWLTSPDHPLTARVAMNRVWQRIFGRGLAPTVDDFGKQGQPPSHPDLLDWLAAEYIRQGWSTKSMIRHIVLSSTYRQSSARRRELEAVDPENVWLARQNRHRVEAEVIRDLALAASGLLDARVGGPSVRPRQPSEYSKLTYANSAKWEVSPGGDAYRRGVYTFFQRTSPYPMLLTFDTPDSTTYCAVRMQSNTPLQALTIWNDPVFFECASALGSRLLRDIPRGSAEQRIGYAFQLCFARHPNPREQAALLELVRGQEQLLVQDPDAAKALVGSTRLPRDVSQIEAAAWILLARTLLNLDEFITKE